MFLQFHRASGQVTAEVLRNMADSHVLPFDMVEYHHALARHAGELDKQYGDAIRSHLGQPVIGMYAKPNYANEQFHQQISVYLGLAYFKCSFALKLITLFITDYFLNAITAFGAASEAFMERLCKVDKKR